MEALTELAPDSTNRKQSLEAAKQAAQRLEAIRLRLESERAVQEDNMKVEREGISYYTQLLGNLVQQLASSCCTVNAQLSYRAG